MTSSRVRALPCTSSQPRVHVLPTRSSSPPRPSSASKCSRTNRFRKNAPAGAVENQSRLRLYRDPLSRE
jgi:hypothetical protein